MYTLESELKVNFISCISLIAKPHGIEWKLFQNKIGGKKKIRISAE